MYPLPDSEPRRHRPLEPRRRPVRGALAAAFGVIVLGVPMFAQADPGLAPSAAPAGCEQTGERVQCSIAVRFNPVPDATYYTATVTTPGGAVVPYGQIGAGSASLSVAYAGDGAYTVSIAAYGATESGQPDEVTHEDADADLAGEGGEATPGADET